MEDKHIVKTARVRRSSASRIALFVADAAVLAGLLAWALWPARPMPADLPFASAYLFTVAFLLFLRPLLGAAPAVAATWVIADSVVLLAINAAVLVLANATGMTQTTAPAILTAVAVIATCGALAGENGPFTRRGFLAAMFLLNALPVVAWLALAELAGARMDWLFAISPVAAAATTVIAGVSPAVVHAGAAWVVLLATALVVWLTWHRLRGKVRGSTKAIIWLIAAVTFSGLTAGNARAQDSEAAAKLELGVNGEIVAGAWNPVRLMITGIHGPMRLSLVVDGCVTHELLVEPDKWTEFLAFIPSEQPVVTLSGPGLTSSARSSVMPAFDVKAVETGNWPGIVVTGARSGNVGRLAPLTERAPGVKFLEVELPDLTKLPSSYLEQFPVVILETAKVEGPPRKEFVRLTEWMSSRTLAIPPGSRVRRDWPGLSTLHFEPLYGYEVLNRSVLEVLYHPRIALVDPDIRFFGSAGDWNARANRAVLAACLGILLIGTGFYLVVGSRLKWPALAVALTVAMVAMIAAVGGVKLSSYASLPVVSTVILDESVPGSAVVLETRIRQVSGARGTIYPVANDAPAGWVPVYASDAQSEANTFQVRQWKGEGAPDVEVKLAAGSQVLVSTRTKLTTEPAQSGTAPAGEGLVLRIVGGHWRLGQEQPLNVGDYVRKGTGSLLDEGFLDWWAQRAPEGSRWMLRFSIDPGPNVGPPEVHVSALRLN